MKNGKHFAKVFAVLITVAILLGSLAFAIFAEESDNSACAVDGCGGTYLSNGFCSNTNDGNHYQPATLVTAENAESLELTADYAGYYAIDNAGQLYWFAGLVNGDLADGTAQNAAANAVLTADIEVNYGSFDDDGNFVDMHERERAWTPIGNESTAYKGKFDGNKHIIDGLSCKETSDGGLFGVIEGATVSNLGVKGSYYSGTNDVGAIVGSANSGSSLINCYSVYCRIVGESSLGGIYGSADGLTLENCYTSSTVSGGNGAWEACIISNNTVNGNVSNCYYVSDAENENSPGTSVTEAQAKSGELAYLLNGKKAEGIWKQNLRSHSYPYFDGGTVYAVNSCSGKTGLYSNADRAVHDQFDEDGFCTCGSVGYQPAIRVTSENEESLGLADSTCDYAIGNAGQLYWFAGLVNGTLDDGTARKAEARAALIADIVVNDGTFDGEGNFTAADGTAAEPRVWTPIGNESNAYSGEFFGYWHTVSGLYRADTNYNGLFGQIKSSSVYDLGVVNSYFSGTSNVGAIVGSALENSSLTDCYSANCRIVGESSLGGLCGSSDDLRIQNCFTASIVKDGSGERCIVSNNSVNGDVTRCYYLGDTADANSPGENKTAAQFAVGEVAYLLNNSRNSSTWRQTLGEDATPSFEGERVYKGTVSCSDGTAAYRNVNCVVHDRFDTNGFCACGSGYQPATLVTAENAESLGLTADYAGYYAIGNAGQLYWFAGLVNGKLDDGTAQNTAANAVLTANITDNDGTFDIDGKFTATDGTTATPRAWTPIGYNSVTYSGKFDGNKHTISGLYCYPRGVSGSSLIGYADGAAITSLGVVNSYFFAEYDGAAAVAYSFKNGTVENSFSVGCYVRTKVFEAAGFIRYVGGSKFTNCFAANNVSSDSNGEEEAYQFAGGEFGEDPDFGSIVNNVYYVSDSKDTKSSGINITAAQAASGELAYLLNGSSSDGIWKQTLGTDKYPSFEGKTVYKSTVTCSSSTVVYKNTNTVVHDGFDANGFCSCGSGYQPATLVTEANNERLGLTADYVGYYAIGNAGQLYWFAGLVNGTLDEIIRNPSAKAVLTADITVNDGTFDKDGNFTPADGTASEPRVWTPIGNSIYGGWFDGNGHDISGLYFNDDTSDNVGLFGYASTSRIKDLGVMNSYFRGGNNVGAFAGILQGCYLTRCRSDATVKGNQNVGGIAGEIFAGEITSCYSVGTVNGQKSVGGLFGYIGKAQMISKVFNSYFAGSVSGSESVGALAGTVNTSDGSGVTLNAYYLKDLKLNAYGLREGSGTFTNGSVGYTAAEFAHGNVTKALNGGDYAGTWKQTVGSDTYPAFQRTAESHTETYVNGFCKYCGGYEPAEYDAATDTYKIGNAGQLYWFAGLVNGTLTDGTAQKLSANGMLVADIVINPGTFDENGNYTENGELTIPRVWTPLGTDYSNADKKYKGVFTGKNSADGVSHSISGLYYKQGGKGIGLFGTTGTGAKISHLTLKDSYFHASSYVGGFVGHGSELEIYDCHLVNSTVVADGSVGGIVGSLSGTASSIIDGCSNSGGQVRFSRDYDKSGTRGVGGIVGSISSDNTKIYRTFNSSDVVYDNDDEDCFGGIAGISYKGIEMVSCYNTGNVTGNRNVGGLFGELRGGRETEPIIIKNTYNTGKLGLVLNIKDLEDQAIGFAIGQLNLYGQAFEIESYCPAVQTVTYRFRDKVDTFVMDSVIGKIYNHENSVPSDVLDDKMQKMVQKTEKQFASGEVAYLLQTDSAAAEGVIWGQNLSAEGGNSSPVFGGLTVYQSTPCTTVYSNTAGVTCEHDYAFKQDAEAKTITYYCKNGDDVCPSFTVAITDSRAPLTEGGNSFAYTSETVNVSGNVTGALAEGVRVTFEYYQSVNGEKIPIEADEVKNVGTYVAEPTVNGTKFEDFITFTIEASSPIETAPSEKELVYDFKALELINSAVLKAAAESDGLYAEYKLGAEGVWSTEIPTATAAADYEVYYRVVSNNPNWKSAPETLITVTIKKKALDDCVSGLTVTKPFGADAGKISVSGTVKNSSDEEIPGVWSYDTENGKAIFTPADGANLSVYEKEIAVTNTAVEPVVTVTLPSSAMLAGQNMVITVEIRNPYDEAMTDIPTYAVTYKVGEEGTVQIATGNKIVLSNDVTLGSVVYVTVTSEAVDGKYTEKTVNKTISVGIPDYVDNSQQIAELEKALEDLEKAQQELQDAIDKKADTETLNGKVADLNAAIANAETAAKAYADAKDSELKTELETEIAAAKTEAITAADTALTAAKQELQEAIDKKADTETLNGKVADLNAAIANAKAALEKADADNKAELETKITDAQNTLQASIDQVAANLEAAQKELNKAIADGDSALDKKIADLNSALDSAKKALDATDAASNAALEAKITEAQDTLQAVINKLTEDLNELKQSLENKDAELQKTSENLKTSVIVVSTVAGAAFCGSGAFIIWFFIDRKKKLL